MIVLAIVIILVIIVIMAFNGIVRSKNQVDEAWSDIDVQLKRRYDLIPNLVSTVKGYAAHESGVFEEVTKARSAAMGAGSMDEKLKDENQLSGTLKSLFAIAENYPELKANQNFAQLQADLTDTENKIQAARRFYNGTVRDFNTKIQTFPGNLFAKIFGFVKREFFGIDEAGPEAQPVKVQF